MIELQAPTRFWIDIDNGSDLNDGLTACMAFQTPQFAVEHVRYNYDAHGHGVEWFLRASPTEYPGVIITFPMLGQPHDYGMTFRGELGVDGQPGVTIAGPDGGIHIAGAGTQVYVHDIRARGIGTGSALETHYGGVAFCYNLRVIGGLNLLQADDAVIEILAPWNIEGGGASALNAWRGGKIRIPSQSTCYVLNSPNFTGAFAGLSEDGYIYAQNAWVAGSASGKQFIKQSGGHFLIANPFPGNQPGESW